MSRSPIERLLLTDHGLLDAAGQPWPDFAAWCAAHAGTRVALLAGPDRMHSLCVPDDLPLADDDALRRYARLQFTHYFGPAAQAWPVATWPRGACALAHGDLAAWQASAAAHRVKLVSVRPSWTLASPADGHTVIIDGDMLTWLRWHDGEVAELQQRHADEALMRELHGTPVAQAQDLLAGIGGSGGPDFIPQPSRTRPLAWAWAAAAAAACVLVAVQAQGQHDEARRLAEQSAVLDRLARPAPAARSKPADAAARARAWTVSRQLGTDWGALWTDVERALPPDLQLAALDLDRQALQLEGQAGDPDAVTRLVDRLALNAAPGDEVVLTRLQRPDTPGATAQLRFELVRRAGAAR